MANYQTKIRHLLLKCGALFLSMLIVSVAAHAESYTYAYMPAIGSYTDTGTEGTTTRMFGIDYNTEHVLDWAEYENGQICTTLAARDASNGTLIFVVKKCSGYFRNGNSGKIFVHDSYTGDVYTTKWSIKNNTTSSVYATVDAFGDFEGSREFTILLYTSDQVYRQWGGTITVTGSTSVLKPTVQMDIPADVTATSATFSGRVNPNGSSTKYWFEYKQQTSQTFQSTSKKTLSSSAGQTPVSCTVTGLSPNTSYEVSLRAENDGGVANSGYEPFKTEPSPNNPPVVATSPTPADRATGVNTNGTFRWVSSDPDGDAITYVLHLGESRDKMPIYDMGSGSSCPYEGLEKGKQYWWYVELSDGINTTIGPSWTFTTRSTDADESQLEITDGTYFGATTLTEGSTYSFSATITNRGHDVWKGGIYLKSGEEVIGSWNKTIYGLQSEPVTCTYRAATPQAAKQFTLYYQTNDDGSGGIKIPSGNFSNPFTINIKEKPQYTLPTPDYATFYADNITSTGFIAHWNKVAGATDYAILVREATGTYQSPVYKNDHCVTNSVQVAGLKPSTVYFFQVQALNGTEKSEWSHSIGDGVQTSSQTAGGTLQISNATYFSGSQLIQGQPATFVTKITNTGTSDWSGTILLMESGSTWLFWNKKIASGKTLTLSDVYTPIKVGAFSPALYYQTEGEATKNLISGGTNANPFAVTVVSGSQPSLTEGIALYAPMAFTSTVLDTNCKHRLTLQLKNTSSSPWTGTIRLKEDGKEISHWSCHPDGNAVIPLSYDYTPSGEGMHTLALYYQRQGASVELAVQGGNYHNPVNVEAKNLQKEVDGILLGSSIQCSESTVQIDQTVTLTAKIINKSGNEWSGTVYITDNHSIVRPATVSKLGNGKMHTLITDWTPTTTGRHDIGIYYSSSGDPASRVIAGANGYDNPFTINVVNKMCVANNAILVLITRDLAPQEANTGSVVQYHYRVTDDANNRLAGITAHFDLAVNSVPKGNVVSQPSDENGILTVTLHTDGVNAIARPGETAMLKCTHLTNSEGQNITINAPNLNDKTLTLKVHDGTIFERLEKLNVTLNRGVEGEANAPALFKCSAGLDFPMSLSMKWDETGHWTQFGIGTEVKASASAESNDWFDCLSFGVSGEVGLKSNTDISTADPVRAGLMGLMMFCEGWYMGTSRTSLLAVETLESWFKKDLLTSSVLRTSDCFYYGFTLKGSYDLLKRWPNGLEKMRKSFKSPPISGKINDALSLGGSGSLKVVPRETRYDYSTRVATYSENRTLKVSATGDFKNTVNLALFGSNKSWWQHSDFGSVANASMTIASFFPEVNSKTDGIISIKEELVYDDYAKSRLEEISNTAELIISNTVSTSDLAVCKDWSNVPDDQGALKASLTGSVKMKLTSKGDYARYLERLSFMPNSDAEIVQNVFPAFQGKYIVGDVLAHLNVWKFDSPSSLSRLRPDNPNQYAVGEALKMETQKTSSASFNVEIPVYPGKLLNWKVKAGLEMGLENFPSESYYSVQDKTFLPVITQPTTTIQQITQTITQKIANRIKSLFSDDDVEEIDALSVEIEKKQAKRFNNQEGAQRYTNAGISHNVNSMRFGAKRHPALANAKMDDICIFTFIVEGEGKCFDDDTDVAFAHFYPAGSLLAVTETNDTVFVLSEVVDLTARVGVDTLFTAPNGKFNLETSLGADDLKPFGFTTSQPFGVYHANEGSDLWNYVGPAGTSIPVDALGSYIIGTSIKNDVTAPEMSATLDRERLVVTLNITDNIGIRLSTLRVYVNGELRTASWIGGTLYELPLQYADVQDMFTLYIMVDDIVGNSGHLFQMYEYDAALGVDCAESVHPQADIRAKGNTLHVSGTSPEAVVSLFSMDGELLSQCATDESGNAALAVGNVPHGTYIVTVSDGISKKVIIK